MAREAAPVTGNPRTIRTAITEEESERLRDLARGRTVLEVGSQYGYSTALMGSVARHVHAVDWHRGDSVVGHNPSLPALWANLEALAMLDAVTLHVGSTERVLPLFREQSFDFAFHDGDHATAAVLRDVGLIRPLLRPGSLIAFHDYGRFGVKRATDHLRFRRVSLTGTLAVYQT